MHAKRGLSDIVTAILIILLVLVAIGIIWAFLRPVISEGAGQVEGIADVYSTILTIDSQSAQLDETSKEVSFVVSRGSGTGSITGITVILEDGSGNAKSFKNETILGSLDSRRIYVNYGGSSLGKPVSVVVVPMFGTSGGQARLGTESNTVSISASSGGGGDCSDGSTRACTTAGGYAGTQTCTGGAWGSCSSTESCGDRIRNGPEVCDYQQFDPAQDVCNEIDSPAGGKYYSSVSPGCTAGCEIDETPCQAGGYCGNSVIEINASGSQEECDQTVFARTCKGLAVPSTDGRGHFYSDSGTFGATDCGQAICRIAFALGCLEAGSSQWCGDGVVQNSYGEGCDGGAGCTLTCVPDTGVISRQCGDGIDNDGDGWIDFRGIRGQFVAYGDPGCSSSLDINEGDVQGLVACGDGLDNDGDSKIDGNDMGCLTNTDTSELLI